MQRYCNEVRCVENSVDIATVAETKPTLQQQFPEVFSGIGKPKSKQVTLYVDPKLNQSLSP